MFRMKFFIGLLLLGLSTCSWSAFYLGVGTGFEDVSFSKDTTTLQLPIFELTDRSKLSGRGGFGSLFGGVEGRFSMEGFPRNALYLAAELNGNLSSSQAYSSTNEFVTGTFSSLSLKMQNNYGFSLLPGFFVCRNTVLYSRFGYERGHLKVSSTDIPLTNLTGNLNGFRFGLGIKQPLSRRIAFRMEFSRTNYQGTQVTTLDPVTLVQRTTSITPSVDQVEFALTYNIC